MAHIESPKRGRWRVRWTGADGKRCTSSWFDRKVDAQVELERRQAQREAAKAAPRGGVLSLRAVIEGFCAERTAESRAKPGHLERNVRAPLERLMKDRGWAQLADLRTGQLGKLNIGEHRALKAVLRYAASLGQPVEQGLLWLRPPKRTRKPQRDLLRPEQVAELVDAAAKWCASSGALAHVLATYGHRPETAVQVRVGDVDLERGLIALEVKGGDKLRHPLLPATLDRLRPLMKDEDGKDRPAEDFLFIGHDGKPWGTGQRLAQWWFHYLGGFVTAPKGEDGKPCGRPTHPGIYELKRFAISSMLERGLAPKTICSITGHRTPATLHLYARTNEERQREALAVLATLPTLPRLGDGSSEVRARVS